MNKEKYIERTIALFKDQGLMLSMDEIAEKIGVTKKTLYNRFSSKDELIDECIKKITEEFQMKINCLDDRTIPVADGFREGITAMRTFFRDMSPVFFRDLIAHYPSRANDDHVSGSDYFDKMLCLNIKRGIDEGVYRKEIDAELFAKYIAFSIFVFFRQTVMMQSFYSSEYYFKQVIDFNLNALIIKQQ